MGKLDPQERWRRHVRERFAALKISGDFKRLRSRGLSLIGHRRLITSEEWWRELGKLTSSQEYLEWHEECKRVGDRFGLAPWTVEMACLLKGYQPEKQPHVVEAWWPRVRVVTESTDPLFLQWLCYEAQRMGLHVIQRHRPLETVLVYLSYNAPPATELTASCRPPRHSAFVMRVEVPPGYPPEAAGLLQKEAARSERELLRRLGYPVPKRLRPSTLISQVDELKMDKRPLPQGVAYDIVDNLYPDHDVADDQQKRKLVKSRRHKLKKRLVEPYEQN